MALSAGDVPTMYTVLVNSLSADEAVRRPAETALAQCEARPGFCSCLLEIISARGLACREDVRLLATVYFKNSISRYWRHRRDSYGISNEEKDHLRKNLLVNIREENSQIALQLAVLISKIARLDYPKEWPDLFSLLAQQLQSADVLASHRVFMVLFRTLKELSTKRLAVDQRNYAEITSHLFEYTWNLWKSDVQTILQNLSMLSQRSDIDSILEQSNDLMLICDRFIVLQSSSTGPESKSANQLLCSVGSLADSSYKDKQAKLWDFAKRACTKLMKVLVTLQGRHPYSFVHQAVLPAIVDFCLNMITNPEQGGASFEEFLIQSMVFVKSVLECKEYKPSPTGRVINESSQPLSLEQRKKNFGAVASDMLKIVLPGDRVMLLCNILIRRYFIYTAKDLEEWSENPESFHHEQNLVQWTEKQRPCAEALFIVIFENYREQLAPVVVSILREAMALSPPLETDVTAGMLLKDAAYTAAGHVYYELSNYLSFNEWFHGSLSIEISNGHPNMRIIRRKIALLLGQWISEIKGDTRKLVYHALVGLLQDNDIAVRLAACSSLCYLFQESSFSELDLFECLPTCWTMCFKLTEDVQEFDSKVQVLNFISVLLEHAGDKVIPFASQLSHFFQKSPLSYHMLIPILQSGINVDSPDALNLLEDSVLLWETTLLNAPSIVSQLLDLFPYLVGIVTRSFDHLEVTINIIEDYIIFGGSEFLKRHGASLANILDTIVGNVNDKGLLTALPIIDLLIQVTIISPCEAALTFLVTTFAYVGSGEYIRATLTIMNHLSKISDDEHNPSRTTVRASAGAILARLLVMNTNFTGKLLSEPALLTSIQQTGISVNNNLLLSLVDMWIDKVDDANVIQQKEYAMALSVILTLHVPQVIDKLDDILSVCTTVIMGGREVKTEDDTSGDITSSSWLGNDNSGYSNTSKELRKRQVKDSDPIKQASLEDMLRDNLKACAALHGDATFNAAIGRIHPAAFAQLQQALNIA
uniref:Ran binding protein 11-like n=1 Tax=Oryza sativa subsp. japonica TaxID=39947 RepID=Q84NP8_ORYSJ|nr:putative Ran binding protein 11-like [Oryza sativa Japonica Group]